MSINMKEAIKLLPLLLIMVAFMAGCYEAKPIPVSPDKVVTVAGIEGHYVADDGINIIIDRERQGGFYHITKWSTNPKHEQKTEEFRLYFVAAKDGRLVGVIPFFKSKINFISLQVNRDAKSKIVSLQYGIWGAKNKESQPWLVRVLRRHGLSIKFNAMSAEIAGLNNHEDLQALFSDAEFMALSQLSMNDDVFFRKSRASAQVGRGDNSYEERAKKATANYLHDLKLKQQALTRKLQAQYNKLCGFDFNCWRLDSGAWIYQTYDQQYWYFESGEMVPKDQWPY